MNLPKRDHIRTRAGTWPWIERIQGPDVRAMHVARKNVGINTSKDANFT
ncbi:hypothetical protein [Pseudorhodoplanes sp.]